MSIRECVRKETIPNVSPISNPDDVPDNHQTIVSQALVFFFGKTQFYGNIGASDCLLRHLTNIYKI